MARVGDAGDQLNAVQEYEGDAPRPCKNGREWTSETVVESAAPRALAGTACFCGGGMRRNESCATARCDVWTIIGEEKGGLCEGANPFAVAFHRDVYLFEGGHGYRGALRGSSEGWVTVALRRTV